ncbi:hypothetical protein [Chryseobacterium aquaticum]|uniref:hypothetical protein n=1 Tax=Chryseobacterium aquaticum TaxID=452084 RepID=UPI003F70F8C9
MNRFSFLFRRNNLIFVLILLVSVSCGKEKSKIPTCMEARELAKSDFEKQKYVFYEYQYLNEDKSKNIDFVNILKQKNIKVIFKTKYPVSCLPDERDKFEESKICYQTQMNNSITAKFGRGFLDSARIGVQKTMISNY